VADLETVWANLGLANRPTKLTVEGGGVYHDAMRIQWPVVASSWGSDFSRTISRTRDASLYRGTGAISGRGQDTTPPCARGSRKLAPLGTNPPDPHDSDNSFWRVSSSSCTLVWKGSSNVLRQGRASLGGHPPTPRTSLGSAAGPRR
jgi:hypothetical protein